MPPDLRDAVVVFVRAFSVRTELTVRAVLAGLALEPAQFYRWAERYGKANTHPRKRNARRRQMPGRAFTRSRAAHPQRVVTRATD